MPGYPPQGAPSTVLEGDYSDWTTYDSFVDGDSVDGFICQDAIINRDEDKILILDTSNTRLKVYDIATKTLGSALVTDMEFAYFGTYEGDFRKSSAYGTYTVFLNTAGTKVYIVKNGTLKTLTAVDLGITSGKIRNVSISPKGKYIIVSGYITAESAMGWVVLEGS